MYLVYTRYIPSIYFVVYVGIPQVYTRYIPGLEITRYIPGIYLLYTSYIADVGLYLVYTRYIPGKFHFSGIQMIHVWKICYLFVNVYTCEEPVTYMY